MLHISGKDLRPLMAEAGGHRFQRVPPTEKKGRVHTSTVTVAVLDNLSQGAVEVADSDFSIQWFSGTGKGGQHRNKHQNSCRVTHIPTGITEARQGRKREGNLRDAKAALLRRIEQSRNEQAAGESSEKRSKQVGSGMRADKTVTIRMQDNRVQHHVTGKTMRADKYMAGRMDNLW